MARAAASAALWVACLCLLLSLSESQSNLSQTFALPTSCDVHPDNSCTLTLEADITRDNTTPLLDNSTLTLRSSNKDSPACSAITSTLYYNTTTKLYTDGSTTAKFVNTDVVLVTFADKCFTGGLYQVSGDLFPEPPAVSTLVLALPTLTNCTREKFFPCTQEYSVIVVGTTMTLHSTNNSTACGDVGIGTTRYGNTTFGNFVDGNAFTVVPSSYPGYVDIVFGTKCRGTYEVYGDPVLGVEGQPIHRLNPTPALASSSPAVPAPTAPTPSSSPDPTTSPGLEASPSPSPSPSPIPPPPPSPSPLPSPLPPPSPRPAVKASCYDWFCFTGYASGASLPLRVNATTGDVECMSVDGFNCFWGGCDKIQNPPANIQPNVCNDYTVHWCRLGRAFCAA